MTPSLRRARRLANEHAPCPWDSEAFQWALHEMDDDGEGGDFRFSFVESGKVAASLAMDGQPGGRWPRARPRHTRGSR